MKVARISDDRSKVEMRDEPEPALGSHDVLIRVMAASLNFRDPALLNNGYPGLVAKNVVPLSDGAGQVVAIGGSVTRVKVGDRVSANCAAHWIDGPYRPEYQSSSIGFSIDGWLAENVRLPENSIVHLPDSLSYQEAASLPCAAVSAWSALNVKTPLQAGQTVLIQGTGGVALFGLQIARMFNARVLAITSTEEKAERLRKLGAEAVVNYRAHPDWEKPILDHTAGEGVDKVIDIAGEATIVKSAASTRIGGEIGLVGFASGFGGGLPPMKILARGLTIGGVLLGSRASFEGLLRAMEATATKPVLDQVFPFAEFRRAYERLVSGEHVGKVVVDFA